MPREIYEFGGFRLDPGQRRLEDPSGRPLALTAKPFDALVHLAAHAGEPVSRKTLVEALWPDTIVEDNNLTQAISTLRSTIGKGYIATLPGRGYQFVGGVRVVGRDSGAAGAVEGAADEAVVPARARWPRAIGAVVIAALLLLVAGLFVVHRRVPAGAASVLPSSVAVLPFESLSPNPNNAYYAAGLHEEILNRLSGIKSLKVIARTSVLRFAQNRPPIQEIAKELHVRTVMLGSVRFTGDRIRVAVRLLDGRTGREMWAQTYASGFGDVFGVESDIAANVADSLSREFSLINVAGVEGVDPGKRSDIEATALRNATRAIELDPNVPYAHAALAAMYRYQRH